jgi:hypothetical protein
MVGEIQGRGLPMKRSVLILQALAVFLSFALPASGQFTAGEVAERAKWEAFLSEAPIIKSERVGEGVTSPWKLFLEKDGIPRAGVWKNVNKKLSAGVLDSWKYEIAAYRMDKLIGLDMVPPAVERAFRGKPGALVLWIDFKYSLLEIMEEKIGFPKKALDALPALNDLYYIWGSLVANDDPTQQNIRYTPDWRMIFIDHSRAFRSDKLYTEKLVFGANGIKRRQADGSAFLFKGCPRALYERIKALDLASVRQAIGPYLTPGEVESVLARQKLLVAEIDDLIRKNGEDKVLY